jgi:TRAP-type C4-dicarboxylate transport system substrate-binding protein
MKLSKLFVSLAALALALPVMAQNYKAEYRLSTVLGTAFPWGQAGERWAELVKEKTQGRITSRCIQAPRWSAATRRASSPRSARA